MKLKVFVFSHTKWALGRVYSDVAKYLPEFEFRFSDWCSWEEFVENYKWADVCLTNLVCVAPFKDNHKHLGLQKTLFISHGYEENRGLQDTETSLHYGVTSDSLVFQFPKIPSLHLVPNGVDDELFPYTERSGSIQNVGWCAAPRVWWKQVQWAVDIATGVGHELCVASNPKYTTPAEWMPMNLDEMKEWYKTIDILLVTAVPEAHIETGPLAAFEAISSGVLVIGTPVGNFRHVPGPKFSSVEEGIRILSELKQNPEEVKRLSKIQYEFVMKNFTYKVLSPSWKKAIEAVARKKVIVYNKLGWSVERVFRDVEKALGNEYEFKYSDWTNTTHESYEDMKNADIVLTSVAGYGMLKHTDLSKCIFVCHGYPEFNDLNGETPKLNYAMTSDVISHMFPEGSNVFLTPNGVDPDHFKWRQHSGNINVLGWVGSEDPSSGGHKRSKWATEISDKCSLECKFAMNIPFECMSDWYHGIDILVITAGPEIWRETGPLPAYESIVCGTLVIGTRVGNFASIPGPKFETIDEAVEIIKELQNNPTEIERICKEQYEYVMKHYTYSAHVDKWRNCLRSSFQNLSS